jgi:hypothetical protein
MKERKKAGRHKKYKFDIENIDPVDVVEEVEPVKEPVKKPVKEPVKEIVKEPVKPTPEVTKKPSNDELLAIRRRKRYYTMN